MTGEPSWSTADGPPNDPGPRQGPVCWGVDPRTRPATRAGEVLAGIAAAGFGGTELGPLGFLRSTATARAARPRAHGRLRVRGAAHGPPHAWRASELRAGVAAAVAGAGRRFLPIIDMVAPERAATAGRGEAAPRLSDARRDALAATIAAAAAAAERAGVRPLLHPHAGTYVEFEDEIEPLRPICGICASTRATSPTPGSTPRPSSPPTRGGPAVHLKDLDPAASRTASGDRGGRRVPAARRREVDFEACSARPPAVGYDGWMVVEQDRRPGTRRPGRRPRGVQGVPGAAMRMSGADG